MPSYTGDWRISALGIWGLPWTQSPEGTEGQECGDSPAHRMSLLHVKPKILPGLLQSTLVDPWPISLLTYLFAF